jgi:epoxyqueuosine reductase
MTPGLTPAQRSAALAAEARQLGFARVGVVRPQPSVHIDGLQRWLAQGFEGDMAWMARPDAVERRASGTAGWGDVASIVVVAHSYAQDDPEGVPGDPSLGVIARYARGRDYHKVVKKRLLALLRWTQAQADSWGVAPVDGRAYVDTGPLLERELAQRAGFGWFGRNTMLIDPQAGSYFFIGALLLNVELEPSEPFVADRCGTCHSCLDACPTGALLGRDEHGAPIMDARRCISYLTIEHRGSIAEELRPLIGNRIYGCDICQEVCPWNQRFAESESCDPAYAPRGPEKQSLIELLEIALDESSWDAFSRGSAMRRVGRAGFARNVCVAIGNWAATSPEAAAIVAEAARSVLEQAAADPSEMVREHAAWALAHLTH